MKKSILSAVLCFWIAYLKACDKGGGLSPCICGNCDPELPLGTGQAFRNSPQPETASRIRRSEWDSLSGRSFSGKCIPEFRLRTGHAFRMACLAETTAQFLAPERDTFSGTVPKRKLRPGFDAQKGMPFPAGSSSEKRASEFGACDIGIVHLPMLVSV